jgi:HD-GYP domain-containing protein (c-di-GMP phosphodiesterase class II)
MEKQIVELSVDQLRIGQYVARLDRPWIGTPFLFQGFEIQSEEEIADLRRLCRVVYVEQKGRPLPTRSDDLSGTLSTRNVRTLSKDPVPLKTELGSAKAIHGEATRAVTAMIDSLRRGGRLDTPQLETVVDSMVESVFRNREAITWLTRMKTKDDYVYSHSLGTSVWALVFGRHLGLDRELLKVVSLGAMLLDVGKTRLPTGLLRNPGKPAPDEWKEIRRHVEHGLDVIRAAEKVDARVLTMISTHHERFDGSGYPQGLRGDAIPMLGRIAGIADCYDAMTSQRSYAKAKSTYDAVRELKQLSNSWFQAELVEFFIQAVGVFPTGTLVELNSGEVGVVVGQNAGRRLRPEVMLLLDAEKKLRADFVIVDLQAHAETSASGPALWITRGLEPGAYGIDPTEYFL